MEARVKRNTRWNVVTAFGGNEYVVSEWRLVPVGKEAEAVRSQYLDIRKRKPSEVIESNRAAVTAAPVFAFGADATAIARKMAKKHGIDLAAVTGTGSGGKIVKKDIDALIGEPYGR